MLGSAVTGMEVQDDVTAGGVEVLQGVERDRLLTDASGLLPYCWAETALARRERTKVDCNMMQSSQDMDKRVTVTNDQRTKIQVKE
jgi:hypothetical protein